MKFSSKAVSFLLWNALFLSHDSATAFTTNTRVATHHSSTRTIHSTCLYSTSPKKDSAAASYKPAKATTTRRRPSLLFFSFANNENDNDNDKEDEHTGSAPTRRDNLNDAAASDTDISPTSRRQQIRQKVRQLAKNIVVKPIESVTPKAIAEVLKDATVGAVDNIMQIENKKQVEASYNESLKRALLQNDNAVQEAFRSAEDAIARAEQALQEARASLELAKVQAQETLDQAQEALVEEAHRVEKVALEVSHELESAQKYDMSDVSTLTYDEVGYHFCEDMGPPFLDEDMCLVPGEAVARVEKAPENSRRIFAGIDIMASVDDVWKVLTDYGNLQNVVPNLVVNEVLELYNYDSDGTFTKQVDTSGSDEEQCQMMSTQMKGALLKQVGGAKVVGINFSAKTTLEVREWPEGMPDFAHFRDDVYEGKSREERAKENSRVKLSRYRFPRPFALSRLPTRDISMQSLEGKEGGEFRLYQGVWRMQPLPGCAPEGKDAMRLTYAVEVSPRAYLPVSLVEGRIVQDLCTNLAAIRDIVSNAPVPV